MDSSRPGLALRGVGTCAAGRVCRGDVEARLFLMLRGSWRKTEGTEKAGNWETAAGEKVTVTPLVTALACLIGLQHSTCAGTQAPWGSHSSAGRSRRQLKTGRGGQAGLIVLPCQEDPSV